MTEPRVNYDEVASTYDDRYESGTGEGQHSIPAALRALLRADGSSRILEVGCGTGFWLDAFTDHEIYGLDLSLGMLLRGKGRCSRLICTDAGQLPFRDQMFDFLYCVNAFHHFPDKQGFIDAAHEMVRPGGRLAIIGMDPHRRLDRWYIYRYFDGTYEIDLRRFPPTSQIEEWMAKAGFCETNSHVVERIVNHQHGRSVLSHCVLQKNGTSQLILLSDEQYAAGLNRLKADLSEAEAKGKVLRFPEDISLVMVVGSVAA